MSLGNDRYLRVRGWGVYKTGGKDTIGRGGGEVFNRGKKRGRGQKYSKTVLGCKENRRYEMGVPKIVFRGRKLYK